MIIKTLNKFFAKQQRIVSHISLMKKHTHALWICLFFCYHTPIQAQQDSFKLYEQAIAGTDVAIKMTPIPTGLFLMGSTKKEKGRDADEGEGKKVNVSAFWMSVCEITYDQYDFFRDEARDNAPKPDAITRPSPPYIDFTLGMGKQGGFPANSMSQYAALMFCKWLYEKTGVFYRLPTEAEWEYAARAGSQTTYPMGNNAKELGDFAWFESNSGGKYQKVGLKKPNAWGLYDMLGNVAEWTLDEYQSDYFTKTPDADPSVSPTARHPRTVRGGGYLDNALALRPANRLESDPIWNRRDPQIPRSKWWNADAPFVGFRIVRPFKQPTKDEIKAFFDKHLDLK